MFNKKVFIIIVFFVLLFSSLGYSSDTNQNNSIKQQSSTGKVEEKHIYQTIKNIPVSFGKIFETNIKNEENPDIIIINDIHSQAFAQKNIYSIISFLKSKINIDRIFVEGAAKGKVNAEAITNINKDVRENLLNNLLSKGFVSGTEYFCYTTNTDFYGIEDFSLYKETLKQAYILIRNENYFSTRLDKAKKDLTKLKKKYYSKDMFDFEYLFFNRTTIEQKHYSKMLSSLIERYSINTNKYPEIYNFINIINCDIKLDPYKKSFSDDFNYLAQKIKNYAPFSIYEKFLKTLKEKSIEENLIHSYKLVNKFLSQKEQEYYSYINILEEKYNIVSIFDINKYLTEEENIYEDLYIKIFQEEEKKNISFINQMIFLTEKYAKLNIDFYALDKFTKNKTKFTDILNKTNFIKNKDEIIDILNNEELTNYYNNNTKRDEIFFKNINGLITENTTNILVVGGFHKELLNLFNQNNKKYVVIFPNTKDGDTGLYKQLILDIGSYNFTSSR